MPPRLSAVLEASQAEVIARGFEIGKHDELVARPNGSYARLHQMQLLEAKSDSRVLKAVDAGQSPPYGKKAESSR